MRKIPDTPIPTLEPPELTTWELELKTITPMFGGSAKTREVDRENPVRPSSVRGHLRFWWRATAGAGFSSAKELFDAEEKLWGSATVPGLVSLRIETNSSGTRKPCATYPTGKTFPVFGEYSGYALFPFQGKTNRDGVQEQPSETLTDVQFKVILVYPPNATSEIQTAVHAWVSFGGIGARTRRGCGSLEMTPVPSLQGIQRQFDNLLTLIPGQYFVGQVQQNSTPVWKEVVELYRDFRQGVPFARNKGSDPNNPRKAGRSKYPEPDTIRRLSPRDRWTHRAEHAVQGFPRADLGLPIIFHFIGEGSDHTLQGVEDQKTRFASPIITKALKVEGGYVPALILLDAPHVWKNGNLTLKPKNGHDHAISESQIKLTPAEHAKIAPLEGLPIREALINFAESRGFKKVSL
jgi:CRISPR-associated protein Cmr1